jgi:hypothetical protein
MKNQMVQKVIDEGGVRTTKTNNFPLLFSHLCGLRRVVVTSQIVCGLGSEDELG